MFEGNKINWFSRDLLYSWKFGNSSNLAVTAVVGQYSLLPSDILEFCNVACSEIRDLKIWDAKTSRTRWLIKDWN